MGLKARIPPELGLQTSGPTPGRSLGTKTGRKWSLPGSPLNSGMLSKKINCFLRNKYPLHVASVSYGQNHCQSNWLEGAGGCHLGGLAPTALEAASS